MVDLSGDRRALGRLCDWLRSATESRLARSRGEWGGTSIADSAHGLCVWAAETQGAPASVPVLHPLASGDQLAVVGREFLDWVDQNSDAEALEHWRAGIERLRAAV